MAISKNAKFSVISFYNGGVTSSNICDMKREGWWHK